MEADLPVLAQINAAAGRDLAATSPFFFYDTSPDGPFQFFMNWLTTNFHNLTAHIIKAINVYNGDIMAFVWMACVGPSREREVANNIPTVGLIIEFATSMGDKLTKMREAMNWREHFSMFPLWTVRMAFILDSNTYMALTIIIGPLITGSSSKTPEKGLRCAIDAKMFGNGWSIAPPKLLSAVWISVRWSIWHRLERDSGEISLTWCV